MDLRSAGCQHRAGKKGISALRWFWKAPQIKSLLRDTRVVQTVETWTMTGVKCLNIFPHLFKDAPELLKLDCKGHSILQLNLKINYITFYCLQYSNKHLCPCMQSG